MATTSSREAFNHSHFAVGLARGVAGALLFALPMFLTMEMWELGFYIDRWRLLILLVINIPLLIFLAHRIGFERTTTWSEAIRDASIAYVLGTFSSGLVLAAIGVLQPGQATSESVGMVALQAVPASIGALLGRSQLGERMMAVGALFLGLNVAPTEEMILLSYKMTAWHVLVTIIASIALMHGFVYALSFVGSGTGRGYANLARSRAIYSSRLCHRLCSQFLLSLDVSSARRHCNNAGGHDHRRSELPQRDRCGGGAPYSITGSQR